VKRLIIVGAGGLGREVRAWAADHPDCGRVWEVAGFLDDNPGALKEFDMAEPVLGPIAGHAPKEDEVFVCALAFPEVKARLCSGLRERGARFVRLIHPSAVIGPRVELGEGTVVCPQVTVTTDVRTGVFCLLNCHATVGHDVRIGDWCTVNGHCDLTGRTRLGDRVLLGSGARLVPGMKVGDGALVGAGSVVIGSVGAGQRVFGNPARPFA